METKKNKIDAAEQFRRDIMGRMEKYYHQALSENAKRGWQKRKEKLSTHKS